MHKNFQQIHKHFKLRFLNNKGIHLKCKSSCIYPLPFQTFLVLAYRRRLQSANGKYRVPAPTFLEGVDVPLVLLDSHGIFGGASELLKAACGNTMDCLLSLSVSICNF